MQDLDISGTVPELLDGLRDECANQVLIDFFEDDVKLTYGDLATKSSILANNLMKLGVRKSTHVALMMPNCAEWVIAWMAIIRIGAVMTSTNPYYTSAELSFVLDKSDAQFLILHESCHKTFEAMEECPVLLQQGSLISTSQIEQEGYLNFHDLASIGEVNFVPPVEVTASDIMAIQFTSGTTGFPKGCLQTHEYWRIVSTVYANIVGDDVKNVLVTFPLFYFDSQLQILLTITKQGTVYMAGRHSLTKFMNWLHEYNIHLCSMTPQLTNNMPAQDSDRRTSLKKIIGYFYKDGEHQDMEKRFGVPVREGFGMTEIGIGTYVPNEARHMVGKGSCGLAAPFRELKICDEDGNEVPTGEPGELWFRGQGMFLGYYKSPAANRDNFVGDWFRTGDLATVNKDGYVWIVGRLKEMVKRSGENISAAEIEAVLRQHPDVVEAGVVGVPDPKRKEEVKVYIILAPGKSKDDVDPEILAQYCTADLASFKIPRYWAYIEDFPRTATDKIAKQKLIGAVDDLRVGAFDLVDKIWR